MTTDSLMTRAHQAIRLGDLAGAEAALRQVIALDPRHGAALHLLAAILAERDDVEAAVMMLAEAQQWQPDDPGLLANRAALLYRLNREAEGIFLARRAIELRPDDPRTHMILAEALLRHGEFEQGWREYEWRVGMPGYRLAEYAAPRWNGAGDIAGKAILVYGEQGLGDVLWMIRYVPLLAARGARVIVECEAPLRSLLEGVEGVERVVVRADPQPSFDLHSPVMSLPLLFGTTLASIPTNVPYLQTQCMRRPAASERSIGIVWAGGPLAGRRRCPAALFERLMRAAPQVRWVSLQIAGSHVKPLVPPPGCAFADPTPQLRNLDDTAEVVASLDLVITIDALAAHLAGAMGKPVWTLLIYAADWRWLRDRADSPWYPTMRLFRQRARGDWESVGSEVERELRLWADTPRC
jgi:hypothetical protein